MYLINSLIPWAQAPSVFTLKLNVSLKSEGAWGWGYLNILVSMFVGTAIPTSSYNSIVFYGLFPDKKSCNQVCTHIIECGQFLVGEYIQCFKQNLTSKEFHGENNIADMCSHSVSGLPNHRLLPLCIMDYVTCLFWLYTLSGICLANTIPHA